MTKVLLGLTLLALAGCSTTANIKATPLKEQSAPQIDADRKRCDEWAKKTASVPTGFAACLIAAGYETEPEVGSTSQTGRLTRLSTETEAAPLHRSRAGNPHGGRRRPGRAADDRGRGLVTAAERPNRHPRGLDRPQLGSSEVRLRDRRRGLRQGPATSQPGRQLDDQQRDQDRRHDASPDGLALEGRDLARGRRLPPEGHGRRGGASLRHLSTLPDGIPVTDHRLRLGHDR